jgi:hypothetical protein
MSNNEGNKREIIRLPEFPRSGTPEPVPKRQKTSRSTLKKTNSIPKVARVATPASVGVTSDRSSGVRATRSAGLVDSAQTDASVGDTSDRISEPLGHLTATPDGDVAEAAVNDARASDSAEPASVEDTSDRSSEPMVIPELAASWTLPRNIVSNMTRL